MLEIGTIAEAMQMDFFWTLLLKQSFDLAASAATHPQAAAGLARPAAAHLPAAAQMTPRESRKRELTNAVI